MELTQQDFDETKLMAGLLKKIDAIDAAYVNSVSDDICKRQPFVLSVLLGYHSDVTPLELEELMKSYFLIWEYFKDNKNVQTKKITEKLFEKIHDRNILMLKYAEGESCGQRAIIYDHDLQNLKSKALLTAILFRFNSQPNLSNMDGEMRGMILIGIKTFIECFEIISADKEYAA